MRNAGFLMLIFTLSATAALAQEWPANPAQATRPGSLIGSEGSGAIAAIPPETQAKGDVSYISGGVSDEELADLKARGEQFNVHIMVSAPSGHYISDVTLRVLDNKDVAFLTIDDAGPYVYINLPAGTYTLEATPKDGAMMKKVKIHVGKGTVKQHFTFAEAGGLTPPHVAKDRLN